MPFLQVALDVPVDTLFDYRHPDASEEDVGRLVVVPFGRAHRVGVITGVSDSTMIEASRVRQAARIARHLPRVPAEILDLARFCHRYYHHPLGEILLGVLPTALRRTEATALTPDRAFRLTATGRSLDLAAVPARATVQRRLLESLAAAPALGVPEINALGVSAMRVLRVFMHSGWVEETASPDPVVAAAAKLFVHER